MNAIKLNKREIDQIPVPENDVFYWDRDLKDFGLRAYKSGKRTFILQAAAEDVRALEKR